MKTQILANDYHCSIAVNNSVKEVFENICHVSAWWTTNFEGMARKLNDIFTVRFGETFVTFKVKDVIDNKKIVWQVLDCNLHWLKDKKEWKGTNIVWEILSKEASTQIDMTHAGLVPKIECYGSCEKGWNHYVKESLYKLLTEKKGLPD